MTATATLTTVETPIKRDRWGRPLIVPPDGGDPIPYTRASTVGKALDDTYNLMKWRQRMTALGIAARRDLLLGIQAHSDPDEDKKTLDELCEKAVEAAKGSAAATTGTALHKLSERVDRGEDLPTLDTDAQADLDAYRRITEPLEVIAIEEFVICDEVQAAGTPDRIVNWRGTNYIADLKTGYVGDLNIGNIACQLAIYSHGIGYHPTSGRRDDWPDIYPDAAIVIHVPEGTGDGRLLWVDTGTAWKFAIPLALQVRDWRKRSGLSKEFSP